MLLPFYTAISFVLFVGLISFDFNLKDRERRREKETKIHYFNNVFQDSTLPVFQNPVDQRSGGKTSIQVSHKWVAES